MIDVPRSQEALTRPRSFHEREALFYFFVYLSDTECLKLRGVLDVVYAKNTDPMDIEHRLGR